MDKSLENVETPATITSSKLVSPSISAFPETSRVVTSNSPPMVTLLGSPIVTALPVALVSISFDVPEILKVSLSRSIAIVPLSVVTSRSSALI